MNKSDVLFAIICSILVLGVYAYMHPELTGKLVSLFESSVPAKTPNSAQSSGSGKAVVVTHENFVSYAQSQKMINDLPKGSVLVLKFYYLNNGQREWEDYYSFEDGTVYKGEAENPDIIFILPSKYFSDLGRIGLCNTIKKANNNGDLESEEKLSSVKLLWKYKSMIKYKRCL